MATRMDLQLKLEEILGSSEVYFQPAGSPGKIAGAHYPAIFYSHDKYDTSKADNTSYLIHKRYALIFVYKEPEQEEIIRKLLELPMCSHRQHYISGNLNHDVFGLYF